MTFFAKNKSIVIGLAAILVIALLYLIFFDKSAPPDLSTTSTAAAPSELFFVNLESQLDPIGFDTSVFSDPRWSALVDIRTAITPETPGRVDPFASIPGVSAQ